MVQRRWQRSVAAGCRRRCAAIFVSAALVGSVGVLAPLLRDHAASPWVTALALVAMAAPSAWATWRILGARRAALVLGMLSLYAYGVETVGATTGLPYGEFAYHQRLGPQLGWVPAALPLGYVPLVLGAQSLVGPWARHRPRMAPLLAALFLVACDLVLDPGAVLLGIWSYADGGPYYGVPWQNFAGWCLTGLGAVLLGQLAMGSCPLAGRPLDLGNEGFSAAHKAGLAPPAVGMLLGPWWILAFWLGVAFAGRMLVPLVIGGILMALLGGAMCRRGRPGAAA